MQQRFKRYRDAGGRRRTNAGVVLEAIGTNHDRLGEIIAASRRSAAPGGDLFPVDPATVRYLGSGSVQIQLSLTEEQLDVMDRVTEELGFAKWATWVAPVLNEFLPGTKDS
ncbi:hypothetical protein [Saccharopolyspora sp. NPDC049357]|uniref:hypothetical protein n=1 Tax=Saccharopolyspora sp. NPDC049357 TaxID=3154507 RepID=UPI0034339939